MRFQSFDCPLSVIEYPLPAKFCYIDFMKTLHAEVRESEEAAEITRKFGWEVHNDQIEPGSFGGMCDAAWTTEAQFHRRQFTRKVCVYGSAPNGMVTFGVPGPYSNGARFGGHWITSDAICVLPHGEESMVHLPANQLFTIFGIMCESLGRAWQAMAQTSFRLRTGALPVPTAFMPPLRRAVSPVLMLCSPFFCRMILRISQVRRAFSVN